MRMSKKKHKLDQVDPAWIEKLSPFLEGLSSVYFRSEFEGWENIPSRNALFVGNHNGLLTFEILVLFHEWWKRFGSEQKALGLAHEMVFKSPFLKWMMPKLGAVRAHPEIAAQALDEGYSLLVYPGGEKESFRPYKERKKIDFYGRKGFLRLALKTRVPIVPVVSIGAHESYVILSRGEEIAEKTRAQRSFSFAWCSDYLSISFLHVVSEYGGFYVLSSFACAGSVCFYFCSDARSNEFSNSSSD